MRMRDCCTVAGLVLAMMAAEADAQRRPGRRLGDLQVGDVAANFTINDVAGQRTVKLSELRGKPVVLIFGSCT